MHHQTERDDMIVALCSIALWSAILSSEAGSNDIVETGMGLGQRHPDFDLPNLAGELTRLSDYRGKKVVLIHFASW